MEGVQSFARAGGPVIGICNGFQVLTEMGLLPGALMKNRGIKFINRSVTTRVEQSQTISTNKYAAGTVISIPIAHSIGNYFADEATLDRLEERGLVAFRYCDEAGEITPESNPNGSLDNIAGICNEGRNVLGMMPHPDRSSDPILGMNDGFKIFESMVGRLAISS